MLGLASGKIGIRVFMPIGLHYSQSATLTASSKFSNSKVQLISTISAMAISTLFRSQIRHIMITPQKLGNAFGKTKINVIMMYGLNLIHNVNFIISLKLGLSEEKLKSSSGVVSLSQNNQLIRHNQLPHSHNLVSESLTILPMALAPSLK